MRTILFIDHQSLINVTILVVQIPEYRSMIEFRNFKLLSRNRFGIYTYCIIISSQGIGSQYYMQDKFSKATLTVPKNKVKSLFRNQERSIISLYYKLLFSASSLCRPINSFFVLWSYFLSWDKTGST